MYASTPASPIMRWGPDEGSNMPDFASRKEESVSARENVLFAHGDEVTRPPGGGR